jgi:hypothetical protein
MSRTAYPSKLPASVEAAATRLAMARDLLKFTRKAGRETPSDSDRR